MFEISILNSNSTLLTLMLKNWIESRVGYGINIKYLYVVENGIYVRASWVETKHGNEKPRLHSAC